MILAVLDGVGLVWIERALVREFLESSRLISVLDDFAMRYQPDYLYYPNRQIPPTLRALVDFLRV